MKCEIISSVMDQKDDKTIVGRMGIDDTDSCLIINQIAGDMEPKKDIGKGNHRFMSYREQGLSRSRNHALENSVGDILILSDDDMEFVRQYQKIVSEAYEKYPNADIVAFDYVRVDKSRKTMRSGKVGFLRSMKISSAQLTFKRDSVEKVGVKFDEDFGTGSEKYNWGEENIFLFDCLRAGLKVYYCAEVVRIVRQDLGSTWDKSNTPEHFEQQGAIYYRMSSRWWRALALQFALRKRKIYGKDMNGWAVYRAMVRGAKAYRGGLRNG